MLPPQYYLNAGYPKDTEKLFSDMEINNTCIFHFMKGCLLFYGASFRLGGQHTTNQGSIESYSEQMKACMSHKEWITLLESKKIHVDVCISSYTTPFNQDLLSVYPHVTKYTFHSELIGQNNLIDNGLRQIHLPSYDFVFLLRIDIYLKPYFLNMVPTWKEIRWPSICMKPRHTTLHKHPRVNDMMLYVPKKYYICLPYFKKGYGHDLWDFLIRHTHLTYRDLDTMLPTFHDSDSAKDFNPLYYIVNREQSPIHHTRDTFHKSDYVHVNFKVR